MNNKDESKVEQSKECVICPKCNSEMQSIQICHMQCMNCGAHLDCSDKGNYW